MESFFGLLNNAALMLGLCAVYDAFGIYSITRKPLKYSITGVLVGIIAIVVMLNPWSLQPGVFFDTRWVLGSLCGLFFGVVPTTIAVVIAGMFRLYQGGPGGIVGTVVIVTTACAGLVWRYFSKKYKRPLGWKELYIFGVVVQLVMLSCMILMPPEMRLPIIKAVALPILLIYPVLTVIIGLVLKRQEDRRKTDQKLIESEKRYKNIFKNNQSIMLLVDPETADIIDANPAAVSFYGWRYKDLIRKKITQINMLEDEEVFDRIEKVRQQKQKHFFFKHQLASGEIRDVEVYSSPIEIRGQKVLYSIIHDITERKKAEISLKESEDKFRSMMEAMSDAAFICSPGYRITYANPAMERLVGSDATGEFCYKVIFNQNEICRWCAFDKVRQGEHVENEITSPDSSNIYSVVSSPIHLSDGQVSKLSIFRDITHVKLMEAQLRQAQKMESIGTLAGGVAHDFNNLLYMILGNTELALESIKKRNPLYKNLKEVKSAALKAAGVTKQLLNFSKKTEHELKPIEIVAVVNDAIDFLRSTIPSSIKIKKRLSDKKITVLGDPIQINQILMNICTNAYQEMEKSGGKIEITAEETVIEKDSIKPQTDLEKGTYFKVMIRDNGPGIPDDIIDQIFDPYFTTKKFGQGSGMGLSIVHGLVKNHNGAIKVDSRIGMETTFTIFFPVTDQKPEISVKNKESLPKGTETILFIDDEKTILDMSKRFLEKLGYKVETRANPEDAITVFKSDPRKFDLVITDMTMPQMNGVDLSENLLAVRPDIPIIVCTGYSTLINEESIEKIGISELVIKPVSLQQLAKTIRNVLKGQAVESGQACS